MRLSVFIPTKSPQLFIDLRKIYQDYLLEQQINNESLNALIESSHSQLYVTMFNGRHLGAVNVTLSENTAILSLLTIRALTRRRGVAKNLLKEVEKQLKKDGVKHIKMDCCAISPTEKEGLVLFMQDSGYHLEKDSLKKSLSI